MTCTLCYDHIKNEALYLDENESCFYIELPHKILEGWAMILPKRCVPTVFDLSENEMSDSLKLLKKHQARLEEEIKPDGYNIGWNCGKIGGQTTMHAHMHLIPRFADEPFAGKGLRHWLKLQENKRPSKK
jgi:diadenosine tetraphosphate (Ap4A) HIT family hydrolase